MLPFAAELLQDLDELGSDSDQIVETLSSLSIGAEHSVLDLGCGKGAVSLEVASALGCAVVGVDGHEDFIVQARQAAVKEGLAGRATFHVADARGFSGSFDAVLALALGDVLGSPTQTMAKLRELTPSGGIIVVSDGYLSKPGDTRPTGFEDYRDRKGMLAGYMAHGDALVGEWLFEEEPDGPSEEDETALIACRAKDLARAHPQLKPYLEEYVQGQQDIVAWMDQHFVDATWVFRRA